MLCAAGPDDQYLDIYTLLREADAIAATEPATALERYTKAQTLLQGFQKGNPNWNAAVVRFRLTYLAQQIAVLSAKVRPPAPAPAPEPAASTAAASAETQRELAGLRERARDLEADKALLKAKLHEALAALPAAVDPRELARVEERVRDLQKENALLKVAREAVKSAPKTEDSSLKRTRAELESVSKLLATESERAKQLLAENAAINQRLAELTQGGAGEDLARAQKALESANRELTDQRQAASRLGLERDDLQKRVDQLEAVVAKTATLRQQNETYQARINELEAEIRQKTLAAGADALDRTEKQALQKRIGELEGELDQAAGWRRENERNVEKIRQMEEALNRATAGVAGAPASRSEKQALQKRIDDLDKELDRMAGLKRENSRSQERIRKLEAEAGRKEELLAANAAASRREKQAFEARIDDLEAGARKAAAARKENEKALAQIRKLEQELSASSRGGAGAGKENTSRRERALGNKVAELEKEVASYQARLAALEAKPVPLTPEELALFQAPAPALPGPVKSRAREFTGASGNLMAEANKHFSARDYEKAEENLQAIAAREPQPNVEILTKLAAAQLGRGELDMADKSLDQALGLQGDDPEALRLRGVTRYRQGKMSDAVNALSRATRLDPKNAETLNYLGLALSHQGQRLPAESALRRALEIQPGYPSAHYNLAVIYLSQQPPSPELARWHYQKALAGGQPRNLEFEDTLSRRETTPAEPTPAKP